MKKTIMFLILIVVIALVYGWYSVTQPVFSKIEKADTGISFNAETLNFNVNTLVRKFFPRSEKYAVNLEKCAQFIKSEFVKFTSLTRFHTFTINGEQYHNVIASFGPQEGARIIVGAHYDTAGEQPGADDNASGVAALIALAEHLSKTELKHRIDLVAYTLEEPPYFRTSNMGSAWHVDWLKQNEVDVKLMVALEMLGFYSDEPGSQTYPLPLLKLFYPDTANYIAVVGVMGDGGVTKRAKVLMKSSNNVPVYSINAPRFIPGIDFSDHINFWNEGYPAIMITDTAFYRNQHYHTGGDVPEILDYEKMAEVLKGVYYMILNY